MPTYEYHCENCGHEFERFQKMSDEPIAVCPECGRSSVVRRISTGGGIVFKGPGFYATDYRKSPPPGERSGTGSGSESSAGGDSSGSKDSGGSSKGSKGTEGGKD